jgi:hypothetical protein
MKYLHPRQLAAFLVISCIFPPAHNARAADELPASMVEVEAHFIRTTSKGITAALAAAGGAQAPALLDAAQLERALASLRANGAQFLSSPRGITLDRQRAAVEAVRELRYPTEWDRSVKTPGSVVPVAFETRNVGVMLEFEPVTGAGDKISISLVAQVVSFFGFIDYSQQPPLKPGDPAALDQLPRAALKGGAVWQPVFAEEKNTTTLVMKSGAAALISLGGLPPAIATIHQQPRVATTADPLQTYVFISCRKLAAE